LRLGIAFIIFSGGELLKPVLLNARAMAHRIVVVYSLVSIAGTRAPAYLAPLIAELKRQRLADHWLEVKPEVHAGGPALQNAKRARYELGREICRREGCTHFQGRDVDEFYEAEQFVWAMLQAQRYDQVIVPLLDYVKAPTVQARRPSRLHVPMIARADLPLQAKNYPVLCDFSRMVATENYRIANAEEIVMHHMTAVRFNEAELRRKFEGHSHWSGLGKDQREQWLERMRRPDLAGEYKAVADQFGIEQYWRDEFSGLYKATMGAGQ